MGAEGRERPIYHASLSLAGYAVCPEGLGMEVTAFAPEDPGCDRHSVLASRRLPSAP